MILFETEAVDILVAEPVDIDEGVCSWFKDVCVLGYNSLFALQAEIESCGYPMYNHSVT